MFHVIAEQCRSDAVYLVAREITLVVRKYMFLLLMKKLDNICHFVWRYAGAFVEKSLTIDQNLTLTCYVQSVKLSSLKNLQFPLKVNSQRTIVAVRDLLANMQTSPCTIYSDSQFILTLQSFLSMLIPLQSESFKFHGVIWFMYVQMRLMTQSVIPTIFWFSPLFFTTLRQTPSVFCAQVAIVFCHVITPFVNIFHS